MVCYKTRVIILPCIVILLNTLPNNVSLPSDNNPTYFRVNQFFNRMLVKSGFTILVGAFGLNNLGKTHSVNYNWLIVL